MRSSTIIREARLRAGLSQERLARLAETSQSAVARWEGGGTCPSFEALQRLVGVCGLELRVALAEPDPGERSLLERTLTLSPEERLDDLVRTVRFIQKGRAAMVERADG